MGLLDLSLRQRRLLNYLQHKKDYTTGKELAAFLEVSSRTIRSEVAAINLQLKTNGIQIDSKHSHGYYLSAQARSWLLHQEKDSQSFLTRHERVRYIAYRLVFSDEAVNLYDLEDEMFVSQTTLEHDIAALKEKYLAGQDEESLHLIRTKNTIRFNKNERKLRNLACELLTENWNYNGRGNTYYAYEFLDEKIISTIMDETRRTLEEYEVDIEDINMIILNLKIAIAQYRIEDNHILTDIRQEKCTDHLAVMTGDKLLNRLEAALHCQFTPAEREEIYRHLSFSRLQDFNTLTVSNVIEHFDSRTIMICDSYLEDILETYSINLIKHDDFYPTLLQYIHYLQQPEVHFNWTEISTTQIKNELRSELEIAWLFQKYAKEYFGSYLTDLELIYLAICISGALKYVFLSKQKLTTVIMCNFNLSVAWSIKKHLLYLFNDYLDIKALMPVYKKDVYNFSDVDLIVSTVNKTIQPEYASRTIQVSPLLSNHDIQTIRTFITTDHLNHLVNNSSSSIRQLLEQAVWHECLDYEDYDQFVDFLAWDHIQKGLVSEEYLQDIRQREEIITFINSPAIVLIHSLIPAKKTCLSIGTLKHRIRKNGFKIRTIFMLTIRPEDRGVLFKILPWLYGNRFSLQNSRFLKTKEELMAYFEPYL